MLSEISLHKFKKIDDVTMNLAQINVLVGGNNSGKSSILQGIHFSVMTAVAERENGRQTFPQNKILYCPAEEFSFLCHGGVYENNLSGSRGKLTLVETIDETQKSYEIEIYRGRNLGNVGCVRKGDPDFGLRITDPKSLFSIYVPGLAGIPVQEEFRSERVVRQGVARGDANLYLRNVLLLIKRKNLLEKLNVRLRKVFEEIAIDIEFDEEIHTAIEATLSYGGSNIPLELSGTGVLQAIQIFAYITLFEPQVLLLDEPDSHLHPNNQSLLARALQVLAQETSTSIILSTHSRHIVDALNDNANFIWIKDGNVVDQSSSMRMIPVLMEIGALDSHEMLANGYVDFVLLTEDSKQQYIKTLLKSHNCNLKNILIFPYKGSSKLDSAILLADFIIENSRCSKIIIHCDRDFMTEEEVLRVESRISENGYYPYITELSDIESYYTNPHHVAFILGQDQSEIETWIRDITARYHNKFSSKFLSKRDDIKYKIYKRDEQTACPSKTDLLGDDYPLPYNKIHGKLLLSIIKQEMFSRFGVSKELVKISKALHSASLSSVLRSMNEISSSA